jgi:hypothetical protein
VQATADALDASWRASSCPGPLALFKTEAAKSSRAADRRYWVVLPVISPVFFCTLPAASFTTPDLILVHPGTSDGCGFPDWFHIAMKFKAAGNSVFGSATSEPLERGAVKTEIDRAKWLVWPGKGRKSVARIKALDAALLARQGYECSPLWWNLRRLYRIRLLHSINERRGLMHAVVH